MSSVAVEGGETILTRVLCLRRSDTPTNGYSTDENVYTRLAAHMELLTSRGLKTEAMWPQWCSQNPGKCL